MRHADKPITSFKALSAMWGRLQVVIVKVQGHILKELVS